MFGKKLINKILLLSTVVTAYVSGLGRNFIIEFTLFAYRRSDLECRLIYESCSFFLSNVVVVFGID